MNPTKITNKEQFVVAMIDDFLHPDVVMSHALFLAKMINKGLIMLHICDNKRSLSADEAEQQMKTLMQRYAGEGAITYCVFQRNRKQIIDALPTLLNAVVVVTAVDSRAPLRSPLHYRRVLRHFADCKIAYLTVQEPLSDPKDYKQLFTTMDFKKESKEKLIWTSYFARFYGSQIHVLYYDYKDEGLHRKWYDNMRFLLKFFNNLNLTFSPHVIPKNHSTFTDINALKAIERGEIIPVSEASPAGENASDTANRNTGEIASVNVGEAEGESERKIADKATAAGGAVPLTQNFGLLLSVTTKERDAIEWFVGTQEMRTIRNASHIPVLYLNPREDLYVLCD